MKNYLLKMMLFVVAIILVNFLKTGNNEHYYSENLVVKNRILNSNMRAGRFPEENEASLEDEELVVYNDLTLDELAEKLDLYLNSTMDGYGAFIATNSLEYNVDPIVATAIILVETGCKWECSYLVRHQNNVGGMRYNGHYMSFNTLEEGITAFIKNLSVNYYEVGLTTPEAMNRKYAENPNWYKDVYYYMNLMNS